MSKSIGIDISGLDPNFKEHSLRGIGRYAHELKKYFDSVHDQIEIGYFDHNQLVNNSSIGKLIDYAPLGRQTLKQQILYPTKLVKDLSQFNVLHFLAQTDAPSWSRKKYILTVHDLIPLVCADLYKASNPNWRFKLARFLEIKAIKNASLIITISQCSKNDLINLLDIPEEKIQVVEQGISEQFFQAASDFDPVEISKKYGINRDRDFILYVGGIDPRKNYVGLIKTFALLKAQCLEKGITCPQLVLVGKIDQDKEYPRLIKLIKENDLSSDIVMPGFVSDEDLQILFSLALCLCFLSLYEGFGLTPLEAMAAGCPVLSSNTSAMPEVLADAALMVDPSNYDECAESLYNLISNEELRSQLKEKGPKQAKNYSWSKTGAKTLEVYQNFLNGS